MTALQWSSKDLELATTLYEGDTLVSPILPNFSCQVGELFDEIL
jgi:hypothetical protein